MLGLWYRRPKLLGWRLLMLRRVLRGRGGALGKRLLVWLRVRRLRLRLLVLRELAWRGGRRVASLTLGRLRRHHRLRWPLWRSLLWGKGGGGANHLGVLVALVLEQWLLGGHVISLVRFSLHLLLLLLLLLLPLKHLEFLELVFEFLDSGLSLGDLGNYLRIVDQLGVGGVLLQKHDVLLELLLVAGNCFGNRLGVRSPPRRWLSSSRRHLRRGAILISDLLLIIWLLLLLLLLRWKSLTHSIPSVVALLLRMLLLLLLLWVLGTAHLTLIVLLLLRRGSRI